MTLPPRLSHLLELAHQGPALRAALAEEVAELLAAWPADYPAEMRGVCEDLMARAMNDANEETRARLSARLGKRPAAAAPVGALLAAARKGTPLAEKLAETLGIGPERADDILRDASGRSLALAARAANLNRCEFSALALLTQTGSGRAAAHARLAAFDDVSAADATRALRNWRGKQPAAAE